MKTEPLLDLSGGSNRNDDDAGEDDLARDSLRGKSYVPSWFTMRFVSLLCAGTLFVAAFLSVGFLSIPYLISAFLCLSLSIRQTCSSTLIFYACLLVVGKIAGIVLTFCTEIVNGMSQQQKDMLSAAGLTFVDRQVSHCVRAVSADVVALLALLIVRIVMRNISAKKVNNSLATKGAGPARMWCWLAVGFMVGAYLLGESMIYFLVTVGLIIILWFWACTVSMSQTIFVKSTPVIYVLVPVLETVQYMAQTSAAGYFPQRLAAVTGFGEINSVRGWAAFVSLVGVYLCTAFYRDTFVSENAKMKALKLETTDLSSTNSVDLSGSSPRLKEVVVKKSEEKASNARTCWQTIEGWCLHFWRRVTWTPFGLMHIVRVLAIVWVAKYNTVEGVLMLFWLYYSAWYKDAGLFCRISPYLIGPCVALQILGSKIMAIPQLVTGGWQNVKYLANFGLFPFFMDKNINAPLEFAQMLGYFALICLTYSMRKYMGRYDRWVEEREELEKKFTAQNNLEITMHFLLERMEKLYVVLLYIVALWEINAVQTLILCFMTMLLLLPKYARRYFVAMIYLLCFRAVARSLVHDGYLFDLPYPTSLTRAFAVLGVDVTYDSSQMIYKFSVTWELILLYFFSYIQLRTIGYLATVEKTKASNRARGFDCGEKPSGYVRFFVRTAEILKKFLLWGIYLVMFTVLAYQDPTLFVVLISVFVVMISSAHLYGDLFYTGHNGQLKTLGLWYALIVCNIFVLLASYAFCFAAYTLDLGFSIKSSNEQVYLLRMVGFDFDRPMGMSMHLKFLPNFTTVYLASVALNHIRLQRARDSLVAPQTEAIQYSHKFWDVCLSLLDVASRYSFHVLFFATVVLSVFWSLNLTMLAYLAIFGVHYSVLHLRYVRENSAKPQVRHCYSEREAITEREKRVQMKQSIRHRRRTLRFLCLFTFLSLLLCQLFRTLLVCKRYVDVYWRGDERTRYLYYLSVVQAVGDYLGLVGIDSREAVPFFGILSGYLLMLCLCAAESRAVGWCNDRLGYRFRRIYVPPPIVAKAKSKTMVLISPPTSPERTEKKDKSKARKMFAAERKARYTLTAMMLLNIIVEHTIVGGFLFAATLKNNVLEIAFIPVAIVCTYSRLGYRSSWAFSVYMWVCLFVQYFMCVANLSDDCSPQQHDDSLLLYIFHLTKWPAYETWLESWPIKRRWGHYFALGSTNSTRYSFVADAALLALQSLYFQHFCHTFYTLSSLDESQKDRKGSTASNGSGDSAGDGEHESVIAGMFFFMYSMMRKLCFVYSHVFTLFLLLLVSALSSGAIMIFYIVFSVVFMQFDLFSSMGTRSWSLPIYTKYILKPYVLLDIIVQFVYQVPYFANLQLRIMPYAGVEDFDKSIISILLKIVIFVLTVYQDNIYSSTQYRLICRRERLKLQRLRTHRQLCMAYLHNNRRVYELRRQKYMLDQNHVRLSQVSASIENWNKVLHRDGSSASTAESGLILDIEESRQKLEQMQRKLDGVVIYPYLAVKHTSVMEDVYLWLSEKINHVAFVKSSALEALEKQLESGVSLIPNCVTDYHVSTYIELLRQKIEIERLRLSILERRRVEVKEGNRPESKAESKMELLPLPPLDEEKKRKRAENEEAALRVQKESDQGDPKAPKGLSTVKLLFDIFLMLPKLIFSSTQQICLILMLLAHAFNGNLMSLVYVLGVLCYAWLVRCRPRERFWRAMLMYAGVVIILKYVALNAQDLVINYFRREDGRKAGFAWFFEALQSKCGLRLGIFDGLKFGHVRFLMLDELIVLAVILHRYVMHAMGIHKEHEEDVESVSAAVIRINEANRAATAATKGQAPPRVVEEEKSPRTELRKAQSGLQKESAGDLKGKQQTCSEKFSKVVDTLFFNHAVGQHLFPLLRNEKPGKDYSTIIIGIQVVLCLYIIVFYSNMSYEVSSLSHIEVKEFSVSTIFALLVQIVFLLMDRYLYYHRPLPSAPRKTFGTPGEIQLEYYRTHNRPLLGKCVLYFFQVILVNYIVFWYLPNDGNVRLGSSVECTKEDIADGRCNEPHSNPFLMAFYVLYCVYFAASAMQIRSGWTETAEGEVHREAGLGKGLITQIFFAIPFGWELQQIASWLWIKTSFDLFQWLKFEEIYTNLFLVNCNSKERQKIRIGTEALNPMVELNNPTKGSLSVNLEYGDGSSFELMHVSSGDILTVSEKDLETYNISSMRELRGKSLDQLKIVTFPNTSDTSVFPTDAKRTHIADYIYHDARARVVYRFAFFRPYPAQKQEVAISFTRYLELEDRLRIEYLFEYKENSSQLLLPKMFCSMFMLNTSRWN